MFDRAEFDAMVGPGVEQDLQDLPYDIARRELYTPAELFDAFDPARPESVDDCLDARIARHLQATGKVHPKELELQARSLHDTNIRAALYRFLDWFDSKRVVGVMGGHALRRTDAHYRRVVEVAKRLTERGDLVISGGGPGAMEATHVGAWLAGRSAADVDAALAMLAEAPALTDRRWLSAAFETKSAFPQTKGFVSLSVPTWHFSSEPPTPFATYVAKFFENSLREDILLSEAFGGVLFTPGGAGTLQEIFQEAVHDHYVTLGFPSPMVFVGVEFWTKTVPVYPLMCQMQDAGRYRNLKLSLAETTDEIIAALDAGREA